MSKVEIYDSNVFSEAITVLNNADAQIREECGRGLQEARNTLYECEWELANSQMLLQEARAKEAECLAEVNRRAAEYQRAVEHRILMEQRVALVAQAVSMAEEMVGTLTARFNYGTAQAENITATGCSRLQSAMNDAAKYTGQRQPALKKSPEGKESEQTDKKDTVEMNAGKSCEVVFVFSCPGKEEEKAGRVCAGQTGRNLDRLIFYLNQMRPDVFKYTNRYDYRITNASNKVLYNSKDGATEAEEAEVVSAENIKRLTMETQGAQYILCMGKNAMASISHVPTNAKKIYSRHLGFRSINKIKVDEEGEAATEMRIKMIADDIVAKL